MKGEKCRSRLVCRETKRAKDRDEQLGPEDVFSPMPPSEGLKMLVSTMMKGHDDGNHADGPFEMATWDVSRAHFYGEARRWIYTYLLEGHEQVGQLARRCRSMHGTRDAASIWGDTWSEVLKDVSMKVGSACPAFFCSHDGERKGSCVVARRKQLQIFRKILGKRFEVKQTGHVGFSASDAKELKILKRTIIIDVLNDEMTLEADTKLVRDALETMKLTGAKGVDSPFSAKDAKELMILNRTIKLDVLNDEKNNAMRGGDERMLRGVYVGHHERSGAAISHTPDGVKRRSRIARMLEHERWDRVFSATCIRIPQQLRPDQRNLARLWYLRQRQTKVLLLWS